MSDKHTTRLRVRNWARFQHYKERRPPWIKLHVEILDEYDHDGAPKKFRTLPDNAKLTFLMLLALASRYKDGIIPCSDPAWIARETGLSQSSVNTLALVECGYLEHDASTMLAPCKHDAYKVLGSETETETETYTQREARATPKTIADLPTAIKTARPEYAALSEQAIISCLAACPAEKHGELIKAVAEWCADHGNALKPFDNPLASLRKLVSRAANGEKRPCAPRGDANGTQPAWAHRWAAIAGYRPSYEVVAEVTDYLAKLKPTAAEIMAAIDAIGEEQQGQQRPQPPTAPGIATRIRQARARGGHGKARTIALRMDGAAKSLDTQAVRAMLQAVDAKGRWAIVTSGVGADDCARIKAIADAGGMEVDET
jgi:hypothetical protein